MKDNLVEEEHNFTEPRYNMETKNIEQVCMDCQYVKVLNPQEQMAFLKMVQEERLRAREENEENDLTR